jgi:4'-phosphopantetheinyl transferase
MPGPPESPVRAFHFRENAPVCAGSGIHPPSVARPGPLLGRFARESGLAFFSLEALAKNEDVPLPVRGWHWSLSHKPEFVAGAVSPVPVGIDLELPGPRHPGLFDKAGTDAEWACLGGRNWPNFFRLWTAKEAVLKALGTGLAGLGDCRLIARDRDRIHLEAGGRRWTADSATRAEFVVAVTAGDAAVAWEFRESRPEAG